MTNKTVSIVMCTYNGERYLKEQLMSLLNQTYSPIEIIIQDDLSTDNTLEIIHDYQERYPGIIHLFQNSRRLGYNQNFLSAYQKANGYYIASADQDDIWETNKIEILIREIGDSTLIFHNSVLFNQKNPNMGLLHKKDWGEHPQPLSVLVKHTGIRFFFVGKCFRLSTSSKHIMYHTTASFTHYAAAWEM